MRWSLGVPNVSFDAFWVVKLTNATITKEVKIEKMNYHHYSARDTKSNKFKQSSNYTLPYRQGRQRAELRGWEIGSLASMHNKTMVSHKT